MLREVTMKKSLLLLIILVLTMCSCTTNNKEVNIYDGLMTKKIVIDDLKIYVPDSWEELPEVILGNVQDTYCFDQNTGRTITIAKLEQFENKTTFYDSIKENREHGREIIYKNDLVFSYIDNIREDDDKYYYMIYLNVHDEESLSSYLFAISNKIDENQMNIYENDKQFMRALIDNITVATEEEKAEYESHLFKYWIENRFISELEDEITIDYNDEVVHIATEQIEERFPIFYNSNDYFELISNGFIGYAFAVLYKRFDEDTKGHHVGELGLYAYYLIIQKYGVKISDHNDQLQSVKDEIVSAFNSVGIELDTGKE